VLKNGNGRLLDDTVRIAPDGQLERFAEWIERCIDAALFPG